MTNREIAKLLRNIAAVYSLSEDRFRVIAYEKAADSLEASTLEAIDAWKEGKLMSIPGIGTSIASYLDELFKTGKVKHFEKVLAKVPQSLFPLLEIPGFGAKKAYKLVTLLKLKNPDTVYDDLLEAAKAGKIATIAGFGEKSQQDIIEALEAVRQGKIKGSRMSLPYADEIAQNILGFLKENKDTVKANALGSLRRMMSTVGDIDITAATNNPESAVEWFLKYPKKEKIIERGPSGASIILNSGRQVDLRVVSPKQYGSMLQYFTGSKQHNIHLRELALKKGLSLSEYGIKSLDKSLKSSRFKRDKSQNYNEKLKIYEYPTEEEFYYALDLPWIPPELREDTGEIEAALNHKLPNLIEVKEIRGDFHIHSDYNLEPSHDLGHSSLEEILINASKLHYEYVGISDHNPSITNHDSKKICSILKRRRLYFEQKLQSTKYTRVKLFIMLEVDIQPDGKLALPEEAFDYLDAVIVSIHSSFGMEKVKMTDRILSGLSHPKAKILGHPTGRLLGKREGYEVDWSTLFKFCKEFNKAVEINAYPDRLDLPDVLAREAIKEDVKLVIGTDSHETSQMNLMTYGVSVARRGWSKKSDIINTLPYNTIKEWFSNS